MALVIGLTMALANLLQEKVGVNDGLGWDGLIYGGWARDFTNLLWQHPPDSYYVQRLLPSALAHAALVAIGRNPNTITSADIVHCFEVMNIFMLTCGAWIWSHVAQVLSVSKSGRWLGAVALFGGFAILKWSVYYPVLGDVWGLTLGLGMLFSQLTSRWILLLVLGLVGATCWPTVLPVALLLLILPARCPPRLSRRVARPQPWAWILALTAALGWLIWTLWLDPSKIAGLNESEPRTSEVFRASCIGVFAFLALALGPLIQALHISSWPHRIQLRWLLVKGFLAVGLLLGATVIHGTFSSGQSGIGAVAQLHTTAYFATTKPLVFLVGHGVFFGPIFLVLLLRWRSIVGRVSAEGLGLVAVAGLGLFLSLGSESRHLFTFAGMLLPFAIVELDRSNLGHKTALIFVSISLVYSRFWLTLPTHPGGNPLKFPAQMFFMTQGPWMSWSMYLAQGALVVITAIWVHRLFKQEGFTALE